MPPTMLLAEGTATTRAREIAKDRAEEQLGMLTNARPNKDGKRLMLATICPGPSRYPGPNAPKLPPILCDSGLSAGGLCGIVVSSGTEFLTVHAGNKSKECQEMLGCRGYAHIRKFNGSRVFC